jgi:hypothetical protein
MEIVVLNIIKNVHLWMNNHFKSHLKKKNDKTIQIWWYEIQSVKLSEIQDYE